LKEDSEEFLNEAELKRIVMTYSEFITFPIYLWMGKEVSKEVPMTPEEIQAEKGEEEETEEIIMDETAESETAEALKTKTVTETVFDWVLMNEVKPLWTRSPKDITDEEYNNFYKAFSKDTEDPFLHIHFIAEGEADFKSLLFIPNSPPRNMFEMNQDNMHKGLKLYVRRVFITDEFNDILPRYLNFLRGLIDSDDLPLNVSREQLQQSKILNMIKKKVVRKAIAMFQELLEKEDKGTYREFWKKYGQNIKLGIMEDAGNKQRLSQLLMFHSSKTNELTSLQEYVERMKESQKNIFYLAGENLDQLKASPLVERLVSKGYEVLFMTDAIDEYAVGQLEKFDGKYKMINVAKEGQELSLDEDKERLEQLKKDFEPLTTWLKTRYSSSVSKAVVSPRLVTSPVALVSPTWGMTANMERVVKAQALGSENMMMPSMKTLEINPDHPLIKELKSRIDQNESDPVAADIADILYDTASLTSGYSISNPADFARRVLKMMSLGFNLPDPIMSAPVESQPTEEILSSESKDEL